MSNIVRVGREIKFVNDATHRANVVGDMLEKQNHFSDKFTDDTLSTDKWAVSVPGTSDTIAISEVAGGECLITTGTADNDSCMISTPLIFSGANYSAVEARILITDVSGCGVFFGFSDAKAESNNSIAIHYVGDSLTTVASDAVGFIIDADSATLGASSIVLVSVANNSDGTPIDTGTDWADGEVRTLRVEVDSSGNAAFWIDGVAVGAIASAVTAADLLCGTVQAITRANDGANTVRVRRVDAWADEV
jgi:hypothetical protein